MDERDEVRHTVSLALGDSLVKKAAVASNGFIFLIQISNVPNNLCTQKRELIFLYI